MNLQEVIAEVLEHLRSMRRFRWWAIAIAWGVSVFGWFYVFAMPDIYRASARVFVDTNSLLRPLTQGLTAQQNPLEAITIVSRTVLMRPNVEAVAHETDLTLTAGTREDVESIVTRLQRDIKVSGGRDNIFTIEYTHSSRRMATGVVNAVVQRFIETAIVSQSDDADMSERALESVIEDHERRLNLAEEARARFRAENVGYMPNDAGNYAQRLRAAMTAVTQTENQILVLTERRDAINEQMAEYRRLFASDEGAPLTQCSRHGEIAELERTLRTLTVVRGWTEGHPQVQAVQESIVLVEEDCAAELRAAADSRDDQETQNAALAASPVYQDLQIQLNQTIFALREAQAELQSRQADVAQLRRDVDKISEVEIELQRLDRDYDVIASRHAQWVARRESLQTTRQLDPVTDPLKFDIVEPPFAPAEPVGPNRKALLAAVLLFAAGAGGAAAFGLAQIFPVFFTRRGLSRAIDLPVLGSVSMLRTPAQESMRRLSTIVWVGICAALVAASVLIVTFSGPASGAFLAILGSVS